MNTGLTIRVADEDDDYLGIEIIARNRRFAGTTFIFAGLTELSEFAAHIKGFPSCIPEERLYEFGSRDPHFAGGYCRLKFQTTDKAGHILLEIDIEDDPCRYSNGMSKLTFLVEPLAIDRFVQDLRMIEVTKNGETVLEASH